MGRVSIVCERFSNNNGTNFKECSLIENQEEIEYCIIPSPVHIIMEIISRIVYGEILDLKGQD